MAEDAVRIVNLKPLLQKIKGFSGKTTDRRLFLKIGAFIKARIDVRTARGKDVDGEPFKPYSPAYKLFRQKAGRPTSKVDLFFSGSMMSAITFDAAEDEAKVFFLNTTDPSGTSVPLKAFFLNVDRQFFAMSADDVKKIVEMVRKHVEKVLKEE